MLWVADTSLPLSWFNNEMRRIEAQQVMVRRHSHQLRMMLFYWGKSSDGKMEFLFLNLTLFWVEVWVHVCNWSWHKLCISGRSSQCVHGSGWGLCPDFSVFLPFCVCFRWRNVWSWWSRFPTAHTRSWPPVCRASRAWTWTRSLSGHPRWEKINTTNLIKPFLSSGILAELYRTSVGLCADQGTNHMMYNHIHFFYSLSILAMLGWSHKYDGVGLHICPANKRSLGGPILREDVNLFITHPKVPQRRDLEETWRRNWLLIWHLSTYPTD